MSLPHYTIKTMTRRELDLAVDWAAHEGWNPGLHDAESFYTADPNGFLMGWLGDQPIAAISAVRYGETFGFLGFYMVQAAFQGRGYGLAIWQAGLKHLQGRNVGLDGVVAQQANYVKSGFELAHRNIRYAGLGSALKDSALKDFAIKDFQENSEIDYERVAIASLPINTVIEYDQAFFPGDRATFLKQWLAQPSSRAIGLMHHRELAGYGLIRACREGYKIGPLFANTPQFAEAILLALGESIEPDSSFYLDVPETNPQAIALAQKYQMTPIFETARMYNQTIPNLPLALTFGITTFELG